MKKNAILVAASAALVFSVCQQAIAQSAAPSPTNAFVTSQPTTEWLARVFIGADVQNGAGDRIGDVNDLMFDRAGRISTVILGVGGFLGMGEKNVAVPFSSLTFSSGKDGARVIAVALSKEALVQAPAFAATEKTTMDAMKDKASVLGHKTMDKAVEIKDQAAKKIDDMTKAAPAKQ